jgi:excisionase family DNA binding protein
MADVILPAKVQHACAAPTARSHIPVDLTDPACLGIMLNRIMTDLDVIKQRLSTSHKSHYTVDEIAHLVGRSAYTVRRWITEGRISAIRVNGTGPKGKLLVPHDQLANLIDLGKGENISNAIVSS